ncbi:MAG TPA: hypothetical protein PKJ51_01990, partial [Methanothrix sp.]|nr:hypothetical protein [Methanothrix sp.]
GPLVDDALQQRRELVVAPELGVDDDGELPGLGGEGGVGVQHGREEGQGIGGPFGEDAEFGDLEFQLGAGVGQCGAGLEERQGPDGGGGIVPVPLLFTTNDNEGRL